MKHSRDGKVGYGPLFFKNPRCSRNRKIVTIILNEKMSFSIRMGIKFYVS